MFSRVRVKKSALNYFRKLARDSSRLEIQAFLLGNILSVNEVEIVEFCYPTEYHTQKSNGVCWTADEYALVVKKADEEGLRIIGDIHSHPQWDAVMSSIDYQSAITENLAVCGICSVYNNRTRVRFWTMTSALPCKVEYV
jgi:proteasome lid subunit RPN8/RPN11